jgi:hypothetical protein
VSPKYQLISYALWIAHPVLQLAVAAAMIRRKLYRTSPFFFAYIVCQILIFSVLFPIYRAERMELYFYVYWTTTAVSVALGFKVIHEIFLDIFRPYHTLKDLGSVLFKWAGLVMLLVAGVVAASSPVSESGPLVQAVLTLQRSVRVIQCGLVFFLLVFSRYLGISWRQRSFGIALGFGSFAAIELGVIAMRVGEYISEPMLNLVNMMAYNSAIIVWFVYSALQSPGREASVSLLKSQRWEQSLTELQHPAAPDSLIPMFEGMVDRAFSRTSKCAMKGADYSAARTSTAPSLPSSVGLELAPIGGFEKKS